MPSEGGPIGVMLAEHDEGRGYVRAAEEAIDPYRAGDAAAGKVIAANLRNYAGLLEGHISKENQISTPSPMRASASPGNGSSAGPSTRWPRSRR